MDGPFPGWTSHGHPIPGVARSENLRPPIARCGGTRLCDKCAKECAAVGGDIGTPDRYLKIRGGPSEYDLMTWPNPSDPDDIEWRLRHMYGAGRTPPRNELLVAASFMDAYRALVLMPQRQRNQRIEQIKQAMRERGETP